ncbi:GTP-dependent dephospho-CoA kinase family protein [Nitrosopumilus sp. K4]|uniref:GTP-dependent dephospho-CoA kinase family protein n=1 Tax=Nitrosopumilus sp. K4 TaxID=2795383 RepID=UPI001BAB866B|nr:GTP-dependent dephospho-CoA kinase family protein [Nitrosopumilus sp. K4]QUC65039.1 GTP-dependent dephospho-CoA kinase family protein [Nitrosopumilus sp. K4]
MKLPDSLRDELKIPLGVLLLEKDATKQNIVKHIPENSFVITVGDRTTEKMIEFGLTPSLQIVDSQEKRVRRAPPKNSGIQTELTCDNPPAEITLESIETIKKAFSSKHPVRLTINGEEDLLVLPVCIYAPDNSVVMYGQPNEGLVIVQITPEIRNKTQRLLDLME